PSLLLVLFNISAREFIQVRTLAQSNLLCFFLSILNFKSVAQHTTNHPESADAFGCRAVNKRRTVVHVVSDSQKLIHLLIFRISEDDWYVEIAQTEFFGLRFFFVSPVLSWLSQVDDWLA